MSSAPGSGPAAVVGAVASEPRLGAGYSAAGDAAAADFWSLLVNARTSDQLCRAWLGILCQWIPGTQAGLLLLHEAGDNYAPAAVWPDPERDMSHLAGVAQQALVERRGVVRDESSGLAQCAYPLLSADQTYGVVVLHVVARGDAAVRDALRLLHWGAGWLVGLFDRRHLLDRDLRLKRSALLQDLLLGVLAEREPEDAARWVVNRLSEALPCRQALVGRAKGDDGIELLSVSGSASFEPHSNLMAAAREAMREAVRSGQPEVHPLQELDGNAPALAASALADYCQEAEARSAIALPLEHRGRRVGALLLDFDARLFPETREFAQTLALALAPALDLHQTASRSLWAHARERTRAWASGLVGPRYPGLKLAGIAAAVALLLAAVVPVDFRVRSPSTVEGQVQRAAVAPFAGFIQESRLRAGDRVKQGDVLARLDDRELKLEASKWAAQAELAERKLREAMARGNAVAVQLGQAEVDEAQAELSLVNSKLARVDVTAPFDGVVVRGDLSQQLGAPVDQGKLLFEVAPLSAWRVVVKVDERDIVHVREGARGELVLAGLPGERFPIKVSKVAPVAMAEEGRNSFRVEAEVLGSRAGIQPGMEGVGKIDAGERTLLWIAFHRLADWVRYTSWTLGL
ncbi:MAG: HlyD family efflux transporter periplasmic adaptor subunit [Aquabacterium sp.]|jgi:RND family efflux transporter MFP subunit|nr:MAG: HlyD family efflux transporter periplasmic adaptor subunit [Aquabacterium sp.]